MAMLLLFSTTSAAEHTYSYPISDIRVIDGDTVVATIAVGLDLSMRKHIRIMGHDSPETGRTKAPKGTPESLAEKVRGKAATIFLEDLLYNETLGMTNTLTISNEKYYDSFGRVLGYIKLDDGRDVSEVMTATGHIKNESEIR